MNLAPIVTRLRDQTGGAFREVGTAADFGVLLVVRSAVESARGGGTLDALEPLRDAVRAALHGWQPGAHLHMRCLDGVYAPRSGGGIRFARVKAPDREEPEQLVQRLAERVGRTLERMALVLRTITALSGEDPASERVAKAHGFSLHAGVGCEAHRRDVRERLCRATSRARRWLPRGAGGGGNPLSPRSP